MRNLLKLPGGGLALALLAAAPLAAQDSLTLDAGPPAAPSRAEVVVDGDQLHFNGDHTIAAGEVVEGDVVLLKGTLTVAGEVHGDVTVAGGDLRLEPGARIDGDAEVVGGRLVNRGARVTGEMRVEDAARGAVTAAGTPAAATRLHTPWFAPIGRGMVGIVETLALALVMAAVGMGLVFYGLPHLRRVSETVRGETARAAAVGFASGILTFPAFVVGAVALAVTIVGIPVLLVYLPLFWVAVGALWFVGLVAVSHAVGERTAEQHGSYEPRHRNAYTYLLTGVGVLLAPMFLSHLIGMTPALGWLGELLGIVSWMLLVIAGCVGFGAVMIVGAREWRTRRYRRAMARGGMDDLGTGGFDAV